MHLQFCAHDICLQRSNFGAGSGRVHPRRTRISFCGPAIRWNIMMGIKKALEGEGDISGLLTVPQKSEVDGEDPAYSRAFETAGSGHDGVKGGKSSVVMDTLTSRQTAAEGLHVYRPQDGQEAYRAQSPSTFQSSPAMDNRHTSRNRDRKGATTKTRFPSLAPAPGSFRSSGDVRAAEAVAHARKTWAPPALRTQAVTSYGAVPDLEIIPEDIEMQRFSRQHRARYIPNLGCPSCTIA